MLLPPGTWKDEEATRGGEDPSTIQKGRVLAIHKGSFSGVRIGALLFGAMTGSAGGIVSGLPLEASLAVGALCALLLFALLRNVSPTKVTLYENGIEGPGGYASWAEVIHVSGQISEPLNLVLTSTTEQVLRIPGELFPEREFHLSLLKAVPREHPLGIYLRNLSRSP